MAGCYLSLSDGILQHGRLPCAQTWGKMRIAVRAWVVADPKIDPGVGGEKNWVVSNEVVVNPCGRCTEANAGEQDCYPDRHRSPGRFLNTELRLDQQRDKDERHKNE